VLTSLFPNRCAITTRRAIATFGFLLLLFYSTCATADVVRVAVASNFAPAMQALQGSFESSSGHQLELARGSTGKHFSQIVHGAPFDVFLAADERRPELLEQQGIGIAGTRATYALGRLVLWSPSIDSPETLWALLATDRQQRLAIANPKLAPYGLAAQRYLESADLWASLNGRILQGENIAQTYHFVSTGNAAAGFIAKAQLLSFAQPHGFAWEVPPSTYPPIRQQLILLRDTPGARALHSYLLRKETQQRLITLGYGLPDD
jgi:molybdate transport system substrate-binding protein